MILRTQVFRADPRAFRFQIYETLARFPYFLFLDSADRIFERESKYRFVAAAGSPIFTDWETLVHNYRPDEWYFGAISYDLKNKLEPRLFTQNPNSFAFPEVAFFAPEILIYAKTNEIGKLYIRAENPKAIFQEITKEKSVKINLPSLRFRAEISKKEYLQTVERLKEHIADGDVYEINYTKTFEAQTRALSPLALFKRLLRENPAPFSALFRWGNFYAISASPERFLSLSQNNLTTQPIKGTIRRSNNVFADAVLRAHLGNEEKFIAENVMIVDLARNDLYRSSVPHSVRVPKLFEVQTFRKLHHLVSTIIGQKAPNVSVPQAIAHAFPPGSMTGAPKIRATELIDAYEKQGRGLYAGSLGYFAPDESFDFNVVIRAFFYDAETGKTAYRVGGAITFDSNPESEYAEALLKGAALKKLFE